MISEQLNIIKQFENVHDVELTIHQISKNLKRSYAFTNKYTHELIQQDILKKRIIGNAIVCSLNLSNEQTLGLLVLNAINKKATFEKNLKSELRSELSEYLRKLDSCGSDIYTVFLDGSKIKIISNVPAILIHHDKKIAGMKVIVMTLDQFSKDLPQLELSKIILLKRYENFWSMVMRR